MLVSWPRAFCCQTQLSNPVPRAPVTRSKLVHTCSLVSWSQSSCHQIQLLHPRPLVSWYQSPYSKIKLLYPNNPLVPESLVARTITSWSSNPLVQESLSPDPNTLVSTHVQESLSNHLILPIRNPLGVMN